MSVVGMCHTPPLNNTIPLHLISQQSKQPPQHTYTLVGTALEGYLGLSS